MQLHFADDSQEQPVEIYHKLKLYDEADPNNPSTKKPVRHLIPCSASHLRAACNGNAHAGTLSLLAGLK